MQENRFNPDLIESGLDDLADAERAGLFRPTSFDRAWLTAPSETDDTSRGGWFALMSRRRWIAAASIILLAGAMWAAMFTYHLSTIRDRSSVRPVQLADAGSFEPRSVVSCLRGPNGNGLNGCRQGDLDGDGDVDLADYSALQVAYASASR